MAALLALLSAITYGTGDFLGGLATRRVGSSWSVVVAGQVFGLFVAIAILPFASGSGPSAHDLAWGAAGGLAGAVALVCFYAALAMGIMSIVAPTTAACSAIVPIVVGVVRGERPSAIAFVGVVLALGAIVLFGLQPHEHAAHSPEARRRTLTLSLAAGVGFGIFFVFLHEAHGNTGLWPIVAARVTSLSALTLVGLATRQRLAVARPHLAIVAGAGIADTSANALYLFASRRGLLALVSVIAALYPASTIVLAVTLLRERLRRPHVVALTIAAAAVVLIALA
jgi:drug/metabolite transporter (DMT)-like permease